MVLGSVGRFYTRVRDWWAHETDAENRTAGGPPIDPAYNGLYLADATSPDAADAAEDVRSPAERTDGPRS